MIEEIVNPIINFFKILIFLVVLGLIPSTIVAPTRATTEYRAIFLSILSKAARRIASRVKCYIRYII